MANAASSCNEKAYPMGFSDSFDVQIPPTPESVVALSLYAISYSIDTVNYIAADLEKKRNCNAINATVNSIYYACKAMSKATNVDVSFSREQKACLCRIIYENDICSIKNKKPFNTDIKVYGNIWANFQKSLSDLGFGKWVDIYADYFNTDFKINTDDLRHRIADASNYIIP